LSSYRAPAWHIEVIELPVLYHPPGAEVGFHFNHKKFEAFWVNEGLGQAWPRTKKSCTRALDKDTWETMCGLNPDLDALHQLYKTVTMPRLNIACDPDGRNRILFGAYGAITSRNTPGRDDRGTYIFAPAKWTPCPAVDAARGDRLESASSDRSGRLERLSVLSSVHACFPLLSGRGL
jgi:hypothetical protein